MTTTQKQEELISKFGDRFYNELGDRTVMLQRLKGQKPRGFSSDALQLANEVSEEIYKEWIETEWTCDTCGEKRTGPKNDVRDEQHVKQEGVFECDICMDQRLLPQDTTGKEKTS